MNQTSIDRVQHVATWALATAPIGTAVAVDLIGPSAVVDVEERAAIAKAVRRRRAEFSTGRRLAREALARLGCSAVSLPPDPDRVPRWPYGYTGSISHSGELCVAVVGRTGDFAGIGLDIEEASRVQPDLAPLICRPDEVAGDFCQKNDLLCRFVAKEAFFKAYFPSTRAFLDFQDVRITASHVDGRFTAELMKPWSPSLYDRRTFHGHFAVIGNYMAAGVWIPHR